MVTTIEVVAGVASQADTVFACRRSPERSSGGRWEFPGGKVEVGERPEEALARELREELGADVAVGRLLDRSVVAVGALRIDLACYAVTFRDGPPASSTDHDELRWVPRNRLAELDWASPDLPMVRLLTEG
ncbi:(deoxy)nucleoside triphosphate pyrophosphohydrolase [Plantibacter sp. VKM Ac-2880]|uniref:(deoxy)nucleoside triphosphate pyrophosphohydrolase n=1 Tax=Plantibacter sp. VKM Ac-2880 TaxID=2783827 RepID=UPI0018908574|nr:(deoxy)nucleoside triphosphate pyrophosphohydrolase [Plantibacter sp. VKM Ac-2880]MBF4567248.1 (deoxy)nucleoside triphosphate pyrophosphohydrolase [Plantibacter sp. VKM Ac-2880]